MMSIAAGAALVCVLAPAALSQAPAPLPSFVVSTKRMDADCDGAPRAYGPSGKPALDNLLNAHTLGNPRAPIVGYLTEPGRPDVPVVQGPRDPAPGYYVSQTTFTDPAISNERNPRGYVDATMINYVVRGRRAETLGAQVGDFVSVHSVRTGRSVFGIVGDTGNPSGDEGSLHLLQALGYPFRNCKNDSVEQEGEVVIRFYPGSNPRKMFFHAQDELDREARRLGLSLDFNVKRAAKAEHPR